MGKFILKYAICNALTFIALRALLFLFGWFVTFDMSIVINVFDISSWSNEGRFLFLFIWLLISNLVFFLNYLRIKEDLNIDFYTKGKGG